jgi:sialate O-acetylesterase
MTRWMPGVVAALLLPVAAHAQLRVNPLFTDGAVLQRGMAVPVWGWAPNGDRVTVSVAGRSASAVASGGAWRVRLPALAAGGPYTMTVATAHDTLRVQGVLVGEVWIAGGQSNMGFTLAREAGADSLVPAAGDSLLRLFLVKRDSADSALQAVRGGAWASSTPASAAGFSAVAYLFARELRRSLGVPVGVIGSYWGGTPAEAWTPRAALEAEPALKPLLEKADARRKDPSLRPGGPAKNPQHPGLLYNAMIAPLQPVAVRGVIWYQGETNAPRGEEYRTLFPTTIRSWRRGWGRDSLPFLFVQLPGYIAQADSLEPAPGTSRWAELRDAQLFTSRTVPRTAMVVAIDQGDAHNLHPTHKQVVAHRLALAALATEYGRPVAWSGPRASSLGIRGDTAVVGFVHDSGGLAVRGDTLAGFEALTADGAWHPARATVRRGEVRVWVPGRSGPTAVRYDWGDFPFGNLVDRAGLPAAPFRLGPAD